MAEAKSPTPGLSVTVRWYLNRMIRKPHCTLQLLHSAVHTFLHSHMHAALARDPQP